ncbi:MAG: DNA gyrase modulator, partial [Albidovulum sp.]
MTDARFSPFETLLDQGRALAILREAVAGGDDGELFLERRRSEALMFDDGRLRTASYDASEGFGLRAIRGEVSGYAHATEISEAALRRAAETARLAVGQGG